MYHSLKQGLLVLCYRAAYECTETGGRASFHVASCRQSCQEGSVQLFTLTLISMFVTLPTPHAQRKLRNVPLVVSLVSDVLCACALTFVFFLVTATSQNRGLVHVLNTVLKL